MKPNAALLLALVTAFEWISPAAVPAQGGQPAPSRPAPIQELPDPPGPAHTPDTPHPDLPGVSRGKLRTYWLAPYVRVSEAFSKTTVTWFSKDGSVRKQAVASTVEPGFITTPKHGEEQEVIEGVNEDWTISLRKRPDSEGFITSTPDSRLFVEEYHPTPHQIALDIYIHGKLAHTVGPYVDFMGREVELNDDGSANLVVWKNAAHSSEQVVGIDANGVVRTCVDCQGSLDNELAAPGGAGALLKTNAGGAGHNTFRWYTAEGEQHALEIKPAPYLVGWVPQTHKSLFSTSLGFEDRHYRLIDWDTGKQLWDISPFADGQVLAVGITPKLIVFSVAELYTPGPWRGAGWFLRNGGKEWVRTFYAVPVEDGSVVARWQAKTPQRLEANYRDRFLWLGGRLFFLTADEVTELSLEDIGARRNGWK